MQEPALDASATLPDFSTPVRFADVEWTSVPDQAGVYVIFDGEELLYVGMAGRNGSGSLRKRLKDHGTGQVVNMFAQYLFLARVQFSLPDRVKNPTEAKRACRKYIHERCSLSYRALTSAAEARLLELQLRRDFKPALNAGRE